MPALLLLRPLTEEETEELRRLAQSQKVEARLRERARICWRSHEGQRVREIMAALGYRTFNQQPCYSEAQRELKREDDGRV